jgi:diaminopimelate decarboxylase
MRPHFGRRDGALWIEDVPLEEVAERFGTPCYVYSAAAMRDALAAFEAPLAGADHLVCYAAKANGNLAVLSLFARLGAGFDIVSGGELKRVLAAGGLASRTIFSGVGKSEAEMRMALSADIKCFNVESEPELERLDRVAGSMGTRARVSLRVNPDIDAKTHPYISTGLKGSKFGIPHERILAAYRSASRMANLEVTGIDCHIGSQITDAAPLGEAMDRILALVDQLAGEGIALSHLDIGGGIGIRYRDEAAPDIDGYCRSLVAKLGRRPMQLLLEPGRALVGNAGVLLTTVEYLKRDKERHFAIVDASMSELIRPALYQAWHEIVPLATRGAPVERYDVVGPVCESSDVLGTERDLAIAPGDRLAILSAGAYAMAMSSNYNARPRPCEVMVDGAVATVVRPRETLESLYSGERTLP